jgi:hypothetical protein
MEPYHIGEFDAAEGACFFQNALALAVRAQVGAGARALRAGAIGGKAEQFEGDGAELRGAMHLFGKASG